MKTKQTIRDSRDANDEQASAQHTLNKTRNRWISRGEFCGASERRVCLRLHALFPFVLFTSCKSTDPLYFSLSLSLFLGQKVKKKQSPHPLCYYCTRSIVRWIQPKDRCFTEIMDPHIGPQEVPNFCKKLPSMGWDFTQRKIQAPLFFLFFFLF